MSQAPETPLPQQIMLKIAIHYCSVCHHEPVVLRLTDRILKLKHRITRLELIPSEEAELQVRVNGELLSSLRQDGAFPDPEDLIFRLRHWQPHEGMDSSAGHF